METCTLLWIFCVSVTPVLTFTSQIGSRKPECGQFLRHLKWQLYTFLPYMIWAHFTRGKWNHENYLNLQANYRHKNQIWRFFDAFQVAVVDIQIPREMTRYREEGRTQMGHLKIDVWSVFKAFWLVIPVPQSYSFKMKPHMTLEKPSHPGETDRCPLIKIVFGSLLFVSFAN